MKNPISFKGTREGIHVTVGKEPWRQIMDELTRQLSRPSAQSFFRGARVQLDTGNRAIGVTELEELSALLAQHQMTLTAIAGENSTQRAFAQLRASLPPPEALRSESELAAQHDGGTPEDAQAIVIRRTIRSGQMVRHAGTVVVIGDVNPGAEVIAEQDIVVWGKLRGVVHAGAAGDDRAIVLLSVLGQSASVGVPSGNVVPRRAA